jgi:hypothetical protein
MGSFILRPVSFTVAAGAVVAFGIRSTLVWGAMIIAAAAIGTLLVPSVRLLTRTDEPSGKPSIEPAVAAAD